MIRWRDSIISSRCTLVTTSSSRILSTSWARGTNPKAVFRLSSSPTEVDTRAFPPSGDASGVTGCKTTLHSPNPPKPSTNPAQVHALPGPPQPKACAAQLQPSKARLNINCQNALWLNLHRRLQRAVKGCVRVKIYGSSLVEGRKRVMRPPAGTAGTALGSAGSLCHPSGP